MKFVSYIISCFFGKTSEYKVQKHDSDPNTYQVMYQGMAIYEGSYQSCQHYISK